MGSYSIEFKKETLDAVCNQLVEGVSLRSILRQDGMPPPSTFLGWIGENEEFAEQYTRAMQLRGMLLFEDIIEDADKSPALMESKFGTCVDPGDVQNKRVRIDTKKWVAARLFPKKYGDNLEFYEQLRLNKEKEQGGENEITVERL